VVRGRAVFGFTEVGSKVVGGASGAGLLIASDDE
jgi:hypothetical protein